MNTNMCDNEIKITLNNGTQVTMNVNTFFTIMNKMVDKKQENIVDSIKSFVSVCNKLFVNNQRFSYDIETNDSIYIQKQKTPEFIAFSYNEPLHPYKQSKIDVNGDKFKYVYKPIKGFDSIKDVDNFFGWSKGLAKQIVSTWDHAWNLAKKWSKDECIKNFKEPKINSKVISCTFNCIYPKWSSNPKNNIECVKHGERIIVLPISMIKDGIISNLNEWTKHSIIQMFGNDIFDK